MSTDQDAIAIAILKSATSWKWLLRIDHLGLYRWYLDGTCGTNLRGSTQQQAEAALRKFVERTLQGELQISDVSRCKGVASEGARSFEQTA